MAQEKMEIDLELPPNSTTTDSNALRRANSVPLINGFGDNSQVFQADTLRVKRNSTTFMSRHSLLFLPSSLRTSASRLHQIKQEEGMDIVNREAMHEREVHTAIQISQSWEKSLNLNDDDLEKPSALNSIDLIPVSQAASITKWIRKIFSNDHDGFILEVTGPPTLLKQVSLDHKKEKGKIPLDDQTKRFSK